MSHTFKTFALATSLIVSAAGAAFAGTADVKTVEVTVKAYELNNADGAEVVLERIERAAERVCHTSLFAPLKMRAAVAACEVSAVETAVKDLDSAHLTKAWQQTRMQ